MAKGFSDIKLKVRDLVRAYAQQHGAAPEVASIVDATGAKPQMVTGVISALRLLGEIPTVVSSIPKGRIRGSHAVFSFLEEHGRLPTAEEVGLSERVLKGSITRLVRKGKITTTHTVVK